MTDFRFAAEGIDMAHAPHTIVGGGLAAASAVRALRKADPDAEIRVLTAEPLPPYERPPLSKGYLRGEEERAALFTLAPDWYADNGVELRPLASVVDIDRAAHAVTTADGAHHEYSTLLLATGSTPRALPVPGADLRGVLLLRTVADADLIARSLDAARARGQEKVVIVGDGWIGMEAAASARALGFAVTVLGRGFAPLAHVLGPRLGEYYRHLHESHGVEVLSSVEVVRLTGENGRVTGVTLADSTTITADLVIAGVGVTPNVGLAVASGLELTPPSRGGGVAVSPQLATSDADIFAAGDVASIRLPRWNRRVRVEHWANALRTGAHAGRAMLGADAAYERIPYFFSDQYDTTLEYAGFLPPEAPSAAPVISGDPDASTFAAFWIYEGRVTAALTVNVPGRTAEIEAMIMADAAPTSKELRAFIA